MAGQRGGGQGAQAKGVEDCAADDEPMPGARFQSVCFLCCLTATSCCEGPCCCLSVVVLDTAEMFASLESHGFPLHASSDYGLQVAEPRTLELFRFLV